MNTYREQPYPEKRDPQERQLLMFQPPSYRMFKSSDYTGLRDWQQEGHIIFETCALNQRKSAPAFEPSLLW
jgi:hypothetical protein